MFQTRGSKGNQRILYIKKSYHFASFTLAKNTSPAFWPKTASLQKRFTLWHSTNHRLIINIHWFGNNPLFGRSIRHWEYCNQDKEMFNRTSWNKRIYTIMYTIKHYQHIYSRNSTENYFVSYNWHRSSHRKLRPLAYLFHFQDAVRIFHW